MNSKQLLNTGQPSTYASIDWGNWSTTSLGPYKTGGFTTAVIAGIITLKVPYLIVQAPSIAIGIVASQTETIIIEMEMRWGTDDRFLHYQRDTSIYGDDGERIAGPYRDGGRERL